MEIPGDRKYTKTHEWISVEGDVGVIGVTHHRVNRIGYIIHVDLPEPEDEIILGTPFGMIESMQEVTNLNPPVDGEVMEAHEDLLADLDALSADPYDGGWLLKVRVLNSAQLEALMDSEQYEQYLKSAD